MSLPLLQHMELVQTHHIDNQIVQRHGIAVRIGPSISHLIIRPKPIRIDLDTEKRNHRAIDHSVPQRLAILRSIFRKVESAESADTTAATAAG